MIKLRIREVIESKGVTYEEVASKMGIRRGTLISYITNSNPKIRILDRIAVAVGCHIGELFEFSSENVENVSYRHKTRKKVRREIHEYENNLKMDAQFVADIDEGNKGFIITNASESLSFEIDEQRKSILISVLKTFYTPASLKDIAHTISRSAWGGSIRMQSVVSPLRHMPEVVCLNGEEYLLKDRMRELQKGRDRI